MRGSKRKCSTEGLVQAKSSNIYRSSSDNQQEISSRYIISNRDRLTGGVPPLATDLPSGTVEDYRWLIGTHHRDFDDHQIYKTTRIYIMRVQKTPYIVADRVWYTKGKYSGKGDCTGIHVSGIHVVSL